MDGQPRQAQNFDGLLAAWLNTLDTEELNKRFYRELFNWFECAKTQAKFPSTGAKVLTPEEHIIRLITRMLFVWFVKEKGLIHDDLFNETRIRPLLRDYHRDSGDSYYRAVLQNLFFATLNSEIDMAWFQQPVPIRAPRFLPLSLQERNERSRQPAAPVQANPVHQRRAVRLP